MSESHEIRNQRTAELLVMLHGEPAARPGPNNAEFEFWMNLEELREEAVLLIEAIRKADSEEGAGDRTVDENEALDRLSVLVLGNTGHERMD